ncbi:class I SAM-dependent methyltransferase [Terasakiella pusilla]|uniref:class I SAM-dependent methyltransferase n=1 Tax=Terasakiella pusilla TaxID=64973 RepID=UPI003AA9D166
MVVISAKEDVSSDNATFWNELCGSQLARQLGVKDDGPESLKKFDDWYMNFYPYLYDYIPFEKMAGKKVLEIGLGYGTVAQLLASSGAIYTGLDIAQGPVNMVNHRLAQAGLEGQAVQGDVLAPNFEENSFDFIVAIGCLHHTGALDEAIKKVYRLLKPQGQATIMVYSAASHRQWGGAPVATFKRLTGDPTRYRSRNEDSEIMRGAYDVNEQGDSAPYTEFVTKKELEYLARDFSSCIVHSENVAFAGLLSRLPRQFVCKVFGEKLGLDLYCILQK